MTFYVIEYDGPEGMSAMITTRKDFAIAAKRDLDEQLEEFGEKSTLKKIDKNVIEATPDGVY